MTDIDILVEAILSKETLMPRWLKIQSATKYAAINKDKLKQLAQEGDVLGYKDPTSNRGDWIFDRHSLDQYRLGLVREKEINEKIESLREFI